MALALVLHWLPGPGARAAVQVPVAVPGVWVAALEPVVPGSVRRLFVTAPADASQLTASAFGRTVHLARGAAGRWEGLIGVDLGQQPGSYPVTVSATTSAGSRLAGEVSVVVGARRFATRRLSVNGQFVDPTPAELERIRAEAQRLATIYDGVSERRWAGPFIAPVPGPATGNFGTRSIFNGQPRAPHAGIDYRGAVGTPVTAPNAGQVVLAESLFFTGNTVILDHGLGLFSLYAHLSRIDVVAGQTVTVGAALGLVGATGRVTGPHLHWALRLGPARVDPVLALEELGR